MSVYEIWSEKNSIFKISWFRHVLTEDVLARSNDSVQEISLKKLLRRNTALAHSKTAMDSADEGRIFLPFIVVNTNKDTMIQCEMSEDREDIFFNFSAPFEINDDTEILRRLQLHRCSRKDLEELVCIKELLPFIPSECEVEEKLEYEHV